jgi:hypothetical protein
MLRIFLPEKIQQLRPGANPRSWVPEASCISGNSEGSKKLPDDGRLLPKHVAASIYNKGMVQSVHSVGYFCYVNIRMCMLTKHSKKKKREKEMPINDSHCTLG